MKGDTGGILRALGMQGKRFRLIRACGGDQFPVSQRDIDQVVLPHIRFRLRKKLERGSQRIIHQMHAVEV